MIPGRPSRLPADPSQEEALARLTRMAARLLATPSALLLLVREGAPSVKSRYGPPVIPDSQWERRFLDAIGRQALNAGAPILVEDAKQDDRFAGCFTDSTSEGPAFLGLPLVGTEGTPLGLFVVLNDRSRRWTGEDVEDLRDLAVSVVTEIERFARIEERTRAEQEQRFLSNVGGTFAASLDYHTTLQQIARLSVPFLADYCLVDIIEPEGFLHRAAIAHYDEEEEKRLRHLLGFSPIDWDQPTPTAEVIRSGRPIFQPRVGDEFVRSHTRDDRHFQVVRQIRLRSLIVVPLVIGGRTLGAIALAITSEARREYVARDLELAGELAWRSAMALENALLYRQSFEAREKLLFQARLLDTVEEAVISTDHEGKIRYWNRYAEVLYGWTADEVLGKSIEEITPASASQSTAAEIMEQLLSGSSWEGEFLCRRRDGSTFLARVIDTPVYDDHGTMIGIVGVSADITERKRAERQLAQHIEALADADRRKDEFLAMLAHELRNPLSPIRNAAHLLKRKTTGDPELHRASELIDRQARHLTRLVEDLLDASRITRGHISLKKERVDLEALLVRVVQANRPSVESGHHELRVELPPERIELFADPTRLEQVFSNLLNNAAKFTLPGGRIEVEAFRRGETAVIRIRDTGRGIAPEMHDRIFELFVQAENSLDREQGGLGIGLTLVKRIVQMHEGTVNVSSPGPDQGSTFEVRLPIPPHRIEPEPVRSEKAPPGRPMRVLIVDDNPDAVQSLADLIGWWGHDVAVARDGPAALERWREFRPELALLDIGLPGMSGYELVRRLQEEGGTDRAWLVALTGYGREEDRRKTAEAGFDDHLVKPVDPEQLHHLLSELSARVKSGGREKDA